MLALPAGIKLAVGYNILCNRCSNLNGFTPRFYFKRRVFIWRYTKTQKCSLCSSTKCILIPNLYPEVTNIRSDLHSSRSHFPADDGSLTSANISADAFSLNKPRSSWEQSCCSSCQKGSPLKHWLIAKQASWFAFPTCKNSCYCSSKTIPSSYLRDCARPTQASMSNSLLPPSSKAGSPKRVPVQTWTRDIDVTAQFAFSISEQANSCTGSGSHMPISPSS